MVNPTENKLKKRVTLAKIAAEAGVSVSTVNYVISGKPNPWSISNETKQRVLNAAKKLGYRTNAAAKALKTGRSQTVLLLGVHSQSFSWNMGFGEVLRGLESSLVPKGYATNTCTVSHLPDIETYEEIVRSGRVDGVIVTGTGDQEGNLVKRIHLIADAVNVPVVWLASSPVDFVQSIVNIDDISGGEQATAHLIEHGHSRIVLMGLRDAPWSAAREAGYRKALEKAGIPIDENLIVSLDHMTPECAYNSTLAISDSLDFSALFAVSDSLALAAILALRSKGRRVPEDCAVIGYDNATDLTAYTDPPLTTIDNPFYQTGKHAADCLMDMIEGNHIEPKLLPVSLLIRESCGCLSDKRRK